ncbi:alcohol dehydrogenase catalytic domain-containing protein, partial [Staphylococcus epidermidis]
MKAITYSEYGSPDVLEVTEQPLPKVGPGMVLVKVKAAAVNPVDWKIMAGYLDQVMDLQFPAIPGWDVAGLVESVGIDAPQFRPGDEVIAYGR